MLKFCLRERTVESLNDTEVILLIAGRYCIASEAMHIDFYTVSQKTGPLFKLSITLAKNCSILIILSLLQTEINYDQEHPKIYPHTSNLLLHYLVK